MGLNSNPAISVSKFVGGFRSVAYTELMDTETNDSENVTYHHTHRLETRPGSVRMYNSKLYNTTATSTARPITGHYFYAKLGGSSVYHVVGAGDALYNYNSSTANVIAQGLTDSSNTFWSMIQIQNPSAAADDIVVACNGVDAMRVWNGTATAVILNSNNFSAAMNVPIAKYILSHKDRVYAINVTDATDIDAPCKVSRTTFDANGNFQPAFNENFYVGGSDHDGAIQNAAILNDQIIIYRQGSIWKFNPGSGDVLDLYKIQDAYGLLAPRSLVSVGDRHIFLSTMGVVAYNGSNFELLSDYVNDYLFNNSNNDQLQYAKAVYDDINNRYTIYFAKDSTTQNNCALAFGLNPGTTFWQPPITGRNVSFISTFYKSNGQKKIIFGDYYGYLYEDANGTAEGATSGYNGFATSSTNNTLTDTTKTFPTTGDGLQGRLLKIIAGTGAGQEFVITANTVNTVTIESTWTGKPDTTSQYTIGAIDAYWKSKDYDHGAADIEKIFDAARIRVREEGSFNITLHYIVNFKSYLLAGSALIKMFLSGLVWDVGYWDRDSWGNPTTIRKRISFRSKDTQSTNGTNLALRFSSRLPNQPFRVSGYDIELKPIGRKGNSNG